MELNKGHIMNKDSRKVSGVMKHPLSFPFPQFRGFIKVAEGKPMS